MNAILWSRGSALNGLSKWSRGSALNGLKRCRGSALNGLSKWSRGSALNGLSKWSRGSALNGLNWTIRSDSASRALVEEQDGRVYEQGSELWRCVASALQTFVFRVRPPAFLSNRFCSNLVTENPISEISTKMNVKAIRALEGFRVMGF